MSASETLELLNKYVADAIASGKTTVGSFTISDTPYGPAVDPPQLVHAIAVPWEQFAPAVHDVSDFLIRNHQVPAYVWFGSVAVPPESYMVALADVAKTLLAGNPPPQNIPLPVARVAATKYVAEDSPELANLS